MIRQFIYGPVCRGLHLLGRLHLHALCLGFLPLFQLLARLLLQQRGAVPWIEHGGALGLRLPHFRLFLKFRQSGTPP